MRSIQGNRRAWNEKRNRSNFLILCFLYFIKVALGSTGLHLKENQTNIWRQEILESLHQNIKHNCTWAQIPYLTENVPVNGSEVFVTIKLPNQKEVSSYLNLPSTLTMANSNLRDVAFARGFHEWAKEAEPRLGGQDRLRCFESTLQAASANLESPPEFYQSSKSVGTAYYLVEIGNGFVHPTGSVAAQCGYYLGQEGFVVTVIHVRMYPHSSILL